jgi:beta-glucanase (GH16 family)
MLCMCVLGGLGASTPLIADATSKPIRPASSSHARSTPRVEGNTTRHAISARSHSRASASAAAGDPIWSDGFSGPAGAGPDPSKWSFEVGGNGWGNNELEYYTARPSNVALDGQGHLAITARRENYTAGGVTRGYTSARLQTKGHFATTFGRIEARIKLPAGRGLWPAFWALGSDIESVGWPNSGEIDVMESLGNDPFTLHGSLHGPEANSAKGYSLSASEHSAVSLAARFHVYGVEWTPGSITFTFDGIPYSTRTTASLSGTQEWVFDKPFFLLLNLAVGGDWPGSPQASTAFPATMLVDWVRVYSR